jgi:hypothetical protein
VQRDLAVEDEECDAALDGAESDAEDADQAEGKDGDAGVWDPTLGEPLRRSRVGLIVNDLLSLSLSLSLLLLLLRPTLL